MVTSTQREGVLWNASCVGLKIVIILLSTCAIGFIKSKEKKNLRLDVAVSHLLVGIASLMKALAPIYEESRNVRESLIMNRTFFECISITAVSFSTILVLIETLNPSINSYFRFSKQPFQNISSLRVCLWLSIFVIGSNVYIAQFLNPTYLGYYLVCIHIIYIIPIVAMLHFLPLIYRRYKTSLQDQNFDFCLTKKSTITSKNLLCCLIIVVSFILFWLPIISFEFAYTYLGKTSYCRHVEPNYITCLLFGYINSVITPICIIYSTSSATSKK